MAWLQTIRGHPVEYRTSDTPHKAALDHGPELRCDGAPRAVEVRGDVADVPGFGEEGEDPLLGRVRARKRRGRGRRIQGSRLGIDAVGYPLPQSDLTASLQDLF